MASATKQTIDPSMTESDAAWGYKFGCEGLRTVVDVAEFLGVSRQTVYRYINENRIRKGKAGKICFRSVREYAHSLEE